MTEEQLQSSPAATTDLAKKEQTKNKVGAATNNNKSAKNGNKKRKRDVGNKPNRWKKDQENYFHRLLHGAQKDLRKQAKVVRNFECQKVARKIKDRKSDSNEEESAEAANTSKNTTLIEGTLEQLKSFDLDRVVQESLRRLGILHLDPKLAVVQPLKESETSSEKGDGDSPEQESKESDNTDGNADGNADVEDSKEDSKSGNDKDKEEETKSSTEQEKALVERILKHKKMQSTLENWNGQVTEYRRWCLQQQDRDKPYKGFENLSGANRKKKAKKKADQQAADGATNAGVDESDKSLFLRLGGEGADDDQDNDSGEEEANYQYGPGSFVVAEKKKNRKGQRARRAKAMAIDAKKYGRVHRANESVNWRPKKQYQPSEEERNGNGDNRSTPRQHSTGSSQQREIKAKPVADESLHPSWAAAKKETSGIVKFQGTKITF